MLRGSGNQMEFVEQIARIHRSVFFKIVQKIESKEGQCFEEVIKSYFRQDPNEMQLLLLYYAFKLSVGRSVAYTIYQLLHESEKQDIRLIEIIAVLSRIPQVREEYDRYGDILDDTMNQPTIRALLQIK